MGKGHRAGRLGEEIRKIIGDLLIREIKDPRLTTNNLVSVSGVEVTSDGSYATIYVTIMSRVGKKDLSEEEINDVLLALKSAKGLMRKEIGRQIKLRYVPDLIFKFDSSLEYGMHIDKIIEEISVKKDE